MVGCACPAAAPWPPRWALDDAAGGSGRKRSAVSFRRDAAGPREKAGAASRGRNESHAYRTKNRCASHFFPKRPPRGALWACGARGRGFGRDGPARGNAAGRARGNAAGRARGNGANRGLGRGHAGKVAGWAKGNAALPPSSRSAPRETPPDGQKDAPPDGQRGTAPGWCLPARQSAGPPTTWRSPRGTWRATGPERGGGGARVRPASAACAFGRGGRARHPLLLPPPGPARPPGPRDLREGPHCANRPPLFGSGSPVPPGARPLGTRKRRPLRGAAFAQGPAAPAKRARTRKMRMTPRAQARLVNRISIFCPIISRGTKTSAHCAGHFGTETAFCEMDAARKRCSAGLGTRICNPAHGPRRVRLNPGEQA